MGEKQEIVNGQHSASSHHQSIQQLNSGHHSVKSHKQPGTEKDGRHRHHHQDKKHKHSQHHSHSSDSSHKHRSQNEHRRDKSRKHGRHRDSHRKSTHHRPSDDIRQSKEVETVPKLVLRHSGCSSGKKDSFDIDSKLGGFGNTPFTRTQKHKIYKLFGTPKPANVKRKMDIMFDPTIFDSEKSSDSESETRKIELKSRSDRIVNEFLIPFKECVETVDKMVEEAESEEELPDLDGITESVYKPKSSGEALIQTECSCASRSQNVEYLYPGLKLSPVSEEIIKWNPVALQPLVQVERLPVTTIKPPKIPRLLLRSGAPRSSNSFSVPERKDRNIFDSFLDPLPAEGSEKKYCSDGLLTGKHFDSSDSSDDEIPRKRRKQEVVAEPVPTATTGYFCDEYSQKYRYVAAKSLEHHWIASEPITESALHENSSTVATKVIPFFSNMVHIIDSCFDEGSDFYLKVLQLVSDFSTSAMEAPMSILRTVLFDILLTCEEVYKVQSAYNLLVELLDRHPPRDEVPFDWNDLELVVTELNLPRGISAVGTTKVVLLRKVLALKYMVCALERELIHRTISQQRQVLKSLAYQWLSCEIAFPHVRSIIRWLIQCLSFSEYDDLQVSFQSLYICESEEEKSSSQEDVFVPKVFPIIEKLLDLSLTVSRQPHVCAERIADNLALEYNHLTHLTHKKFLLESISQPLLRLKLASRILSHCDTTDEVMIRTNVRCLQDIVTGHFMAKPPLNAFTPPATPGSEEDQQLGQTTRTALSAQYPEEAVEELVMLLWFSVHSYLQVDKGNFTESLSRRVIDRKTDVNLALDAEVLKNIHDHVNKLEKRLFHYCGPEVSKNVELYLMCLKSLAHMSGVK